MPFAIKITQESEFSQDVEKYYSQTIEVIKRNRFADLVIVTTEESEIDISKTLVEAEFKLKLISKYLKSRYINAKIVEFPEVIDDQEETE